MSTSKRTQSPLLRLVHSASSPALSMAPFTKVFLLYLASSLFLCSFAVLGQTAELYEEDPSAIMRSQSREHVPRDLAFALANDGNMETLKKLFANRLMHFFNNMPSEKSKRDDDVPPGFIGVRGRRSRDLSGRRDFEDILRSLLSSGNQNLVAVSPEVHNLLKGAQQQIKKSDTNAYKDGFLGVRG